MMMHSIPKPNIDFAELFTKCADTKQKPTSDNLLSKLSVIEVAAHEYESNASNSSLHKLKPMPPATLNPVTLDNLKDLYSTQMVNKSGRARIHYDKILADAKKNHCCFCSDGDPTEIDHFLPKSIFPEFSILPINLVPACHRCNKLKINHTPTSCADTYIHPYYEEYKDIIWLEARLDFSSGNYPTAIYQISSNLQSNSHNLTKRIEHQFSKLQLNQRYSQKAAGEILDIEQRLRKLSKRRSGSELVKHHLSEEASSRAVVNKNSWQTALYKCLSLDSHFISMKW